MWLVQCQRLDQIGPMSHMGPGIKNWLVQYLRLDQIGPMSYMGPGPITDIGPGPMWHMGLAYYWQVRVREIPTGFQSNSQLTTFKMANNVTLSDRIEHVQ